MKRIFAVVMFAVMCGLTSFASANTTMMMMSAAVVMMDTSSNKSANCVSPDGLSTPNSCIEANRIEREKEMEIRMAKWNALSPEEKEAIKKKDIMIASLVLAVGVLAMAGLIAAIRG